ncbi:carboxylesterase/lipase family protein [Nocardia sp. NPDC057030]|uniref:carboxylesterase/lipase family protein n=1 Tax=unclassified Nocardia TaxID=2637762 RepID=UPI003628074F
MNTDAEIRTAAGVVRGRWEGGVAVFRGIPYAESPVGARRFAAPVAARSWTGVRAVLEFGPSVSQPGSPWTGDAGNCLTLNVWSPDPGAVGLPVLVWIHGGRYLEGTSGNPHQDGALLAGTGTVVVSMNYRVGVEGFAYVAGAPNNRGILDQVVALRWVRENVAAFGGDPGNVTVFGQSAGAGCIAALLTMPLAKGLFRRAIAQSVPGTYFSEGLAAAISATIAEELGVHATIGELAGIHPRALIEATEAVLRKMPDRVESWGPMALTPTPFSPVVDGDVLADSPWRSLAAGAARDIDLLVGHTRDEYRLFNPLFGTEVTDAQLAETLDRFAPTPNGSAGYRALYPEATPGELHELVNCDWLFRMPSLHLADAHQAGGGRAWNYELCWSYHPDHGASHSLDVLLVFGTLSLDDVRDQSADAEEALRVGDHMRSDWLDFATTGHPGWSPYDPGSRSTRVYIDEPITRPYLEERSRRIWSDYRFDVLDLR